MVYVITKSFFNRDLKRKLTFIDNGSVELHYEIRGHVERG